MRGFQEAIARTTVAWLAAAVVWLAGPAEAQIRTATPGGPIRVTLEGEGEPLTGTLARSGEGGWAVVQENGSLRAFETGDVARVEIRGQGTHWKRGALIGGGAALLIGVIALADADDCDDDFQGVCDVVVGSVVGPVLFWFPVVGAGTGALVGALIPRRPWVPAALPAARPGGSTLELRWTIPIGGNDR
jgi:hypothetical protein